METILCQYLKYPFHWKRFFHLLEIYFKRILYYSQWQRIFFLKETIFFHSHFFFETIAEIRGTPKFLKHLVFARRNRVLFFQALIRMEVAFWSSEIAFFSGNPSFWLVETDFWLTGNFMLLFGAFLCWWTLEIRCEPIFFDFFYS